MQHQKWLYLFLFLLGLNLFLYNGQISLWDEDEAAYAGFANTMIETGNWVQPEFLWSRIHRKTPLHFWTIAAAYQLFGVNEWATRISSVISVLLICLLLWKWGAPVFGKEVAQWSTIVLATTLAVPITGKMALTDATLLLWQTGAVLTLFNYLLQPSWKWNLGFWFCFAFGVLTKGPLIIILCGGIWLFLFLFSPLRKRLVGTHPWFFGILALLPTICWMFLSWQQDDGELVTFLYQWYVVQRVGGSVLGQSALPGYHLIVLCIAFIPWLSFLIPSLVRQFQVFFNKENGNLFLSAWLLFGWLFFELMTSKLPSYALAVHPAAAILTGRQIHEFLNNKNNQISIAMRVGWMLTVACLLILALGMPYAIYTNFDDSLLMSYFLFALPVLTLLGLQIFYWKKRNWFKFTYTLAISGTVLLFLIIICLLPIVEESPMKAIKEVANRTHILAQSKQKDPHIVQVLLTDLGNKQTKVSLPFYLHQDFTDVRDADRNLALNAFLAPAPVILILNQSGLEFITNELEHQTVALPEIKEVAWWSTDDQLRRHDFYILANF